MSRSSGKPGDKDCGHQEIKPDNPPISPPACGPIRPGITKEKRMEELKNGGPVIVTRLQPPVDRPS